MKKNNLGLDGIEKLMDELIKETNKIESVNFTMENAVETFREGRDKYFVIYGKACSIRKMMDKYIDNYEQFGKKELKRLLITAARAEAFIFKYEEIIIIYKKMEENFKALREENLYGGGEYNPDNEEDEEDDE
jgi:hypothetical protein